MKDKFLTSVLFKYSYNSNLKESTDDFLTFWNEISKCYKHYMLVEVWKKTCFVQFLLKNRALNFSWVFFDPPVITDDLEISSGDSDQECSKKKIKKG